MECYWKNFQQVGFLYLSSSASLLAGLLFMAPARGDLILQTDNSNPQVVQAMGPHIVTGDQMVGMVVRVTFADNSTASDVWRVGDISLGSFSGAAGPGGSNGWLLSEFGDSQGSFTFNFGIWTLRNKTGKGITRLEIDALAGNIVFDRNFGFLGLQEGTIGSATGRNFDAAGFDDSLTGTAVYSRPVGTLDNHGGVPVGDLFGTLTLNFTNPGGFSGSFDFKFLADTDSIVPVVVIPEPASCLQSMVIGVLGAAFLRKRATLRRH